MKEKVKFLFYDKKTGRILGSTNFAVFSGQKSEEGFDLFFRLLFCYQ